MSDSNQTRSTGLQAVAQHEQELLSKISEAKIEAERIVSQARTDADSVLEERQKALDSEVARLRGEGASVRETERQAILAESEKRIAKVREDAAGRVSGTVDELVALVLPRRASGGAA